MKNTKDLSPEKQQRRPESVGESGVSLPAHSLSPEQFTALLATILYCGINGPAWSEATTAIEVSERIQRIVAERAALAKAGRAQAEPEGETDG